MYALIVLAASFLFGIHASRKPIGPQLTPVLNFIIINFAMPALVFKSIYTMVWKPEYTYIVSVPWLIFFCCLLLSFAFGAYMRWDKKVTGSIILTAGYGNNAFIGLPLIEAIYGPEWLGVGAIFAQLGITLGTNTAGVLLAACCSDADRMDWKRPLTRICTFPPFIALLSAALMRGHDLPVSVVNAFGYIGSILGPLVMISIGSQISFSMSRIASPGLVFGLTYKLICAPIIAILFMSLLDFGDELRKVLILQAAVPPGITGVIVAKEFGLDTSDSANMIAIGTVGGSSPFQFGFTPAASFIELIYKPACQR